MKTTIAALTTLAGSLLLATQVLAAQTMHFGVMDTVGNCSVLDSHPSKASGLTILGDRGGYATDADAKKALGSKCKS